MGGPVFVEVRLPGLGTVGSAHTQRVPGGRIDGVLESTSVDASGVRHTLLALVRGFSPDQVASLVADLGRAYGEPAIVLESTAPLDAVIRFTTAIRDVQSPPLQAMARFQRALGVPWMTAQAGEMTFFSQAPSEARAALGVERVQRYFEDHGVPGEVGMRQATPEDLQVRDRLLGLLIRFGSGPEATRFATAPIQTKTGD
jgi:hypothetical protein